MQFTRTSAIVFGSACLGLLICWRISVEYVARISEPRAREQQIEASRGPSDAPTSTSVDLPSPSTDLSAATLVVRQLLDLPDASFRKEFWLNGSSVSTMFRARQTQYHDITAALSRLAIDGGLDRRTRLRALEVLAHEGDDSVAILLAPLRTGPDEELRAYAEAVIAEYRPKVHSQTRRVPDLEVGPPADEGLTAWLWRTLTEREFRTIGSFDYTTPFMFDAEIPGRVYTGLAVSPDSGRTWVPHFPFSNGQPEGTLLAVGPGGRVLMSAAALLEWNGDRWRKVETVPNDIDQATYLPDGTFVAAMHDGVAFVGGRELGLPDGFPITKVLVTSSGTVLAISVGQQAPFAIYKLNDAKNTWLPIGGAGRAQDVATGRLDRIYAVRDRSAAPDTFGIYENGEWRWASLPGGRFAGALAAHPRSNLLVVYAGNGLVVSPDGGRTLQSVTVRAPSICYMALQASDPTAVFLEDCYPTGLFHGDPRLRRLEIKGVSVK
jgi:hypothetical protein